MPLNQSLVGKRYTGFAPITVTADGVAAWRAAISGDDGSPVPPMMAVTWAYPALGAVLFDPLLGVDMMRLLHTSHDLTFGAAVAVGDVIDTTAVVEGVAGIAAGEVLSVRLTSTNQHGAMVADAVAGIFIRGPRQRDPRTNEDTPADPFVALPSRRTATIEVATDQATRFAAASGDENPIHVDEEAARQAGLPGCILHVLCTMALTHRAIAATGPVARLSVRFERPVMMGDVLTVDGRGDVDGPLHFRVSNQSGGIVLGEGLAVLA